MQVAKLRNIVKRYGNALALDHVDLDIHEGEILGLLGPNGAGKTTLIHALAGLVGIDSGSIEVFGKNQRRHLLDIKRDIGLVTQDIAIFEDMVPGENLAFFGGIYGLKGNALKTRIAETLAFVGLSEHAKKTPAKFSGGMKRRLNIACALVHRPKLLIMDEPTVGIDPQSRNHILDSVRKLNEMGSSVIYTSHYMEEVAAISTRVGIMDEGRLIACGTQEELRAKVSGEEKLAIAAPDIPEAAVEELGQHPRVLRVAKRDDSLDVYLASSQTYLQDILFILSKHQVRIRTLTQSGPDLETLFLALTGRSLRD